jgi:hypothetical protein
MLVGQILYPTDLQICGAKPDLVPEPKLKHASSS